MQRIFENVLGLRQEISNEQLTGKRKRVVDSKDVVDLVAAD